MLNYWPFRRSRAWTYSKFYPVDRSSIYKLSFKVKAQQDATIKLFSSRGKAPHKKPTYTITLGCDSNKYSCIKSQSGKIRSKCATEGILSAVEYSSFWITIADGTIEVGKLGNSESFLCLTDPEHVSSQKWYFSFSSPPGACCQWLYTYQQQNTTSYEKTGRNEYVDIFPLPLNQYGAVELILRVQAELLAGVTFLKDPVTGMAYEIIFGTFDNSSCKVYVRGQLEMEVQSYGALSPKEYRGFWIKVNHGRILVGNENDALRVNPFLQYDDPDPMEIDCFSLLCTTSPVRYKCNFVSDVGFDSYKKWHMKGYINYFQLPSNPDGKIKFEFTLPSCTEKGLLLQEERDPQGKTGYELSFLMNTVTLFRNSILKDRITMPERNYMEHQRFCFSVEGNMIQMSAFGAARNPLITFTDPFPLRIKWFSFQVCSCLTCTKTTCYCLGSYKYNFTGLFGHLRHFQSCVSIPEHVVKMPKQHKCFITFQVKTASDAHILLSGFEYPQADTPVYEIVLGAENNTKSCIRRLQGGTAVAVTETQGIVTGEEFRAFWLYYSSGRMAIGKFNTFEPFLTWFDPNPLRVRYISYSIKEDKGRDPGTHFSTISLPGSKRHETSSPGTSGTNTKVREEGTKLRQKSSHFKLPLVSSVANITNVAEDAKNEHVPARTGILRREVSALSPKMSKHLTKLPTTVRFEESCETSMCKCTDKVHSALGSRFT